MTEIDELPGLAPVFPLPDTVLFPRTTLPLHIFEPRYRQMVEDVSARDRRIVIALSRGDEFHSVATVGRLRDVEPLDDGRFNIRVDGEARVRITERESDRPYRSVRLSAHPETAPATDDPTIERARLDLIGSMSLLMREIRGDDGASLVFDARTPLEQAINFVCASLPLEAKLRQRLLEEDSLIRRQAQAAEHLQSVLEAVARVRSEQSGTLPPEMLN